jgi:hypothetical protein
VAILLPCATLFTYDNSLLNGFVWDDRDIIVNNTKNRETGTNSWPFWIYKKHVIWEMTMDVAHCKG